MDLSHDTLSLCSTTSVKGVEHIKGTEIFPEIPVDEIKKEWLHTLWGYIFQ